MGELDELDPRERELALRLREKLRAGDQLDGVTRTRLAGVRASALGRAAPRHAPWLLAGGVAAAAVLAVLLWVPGQRTTAPAYDALEVMTDDVEPDFYQDLDLYDWLETGGSRA